jgi:hypothetical protein
MRWKQAAALVLTTGALCGCTTLDDQLAGRYGPSPVLVASMVQSNVLRQASVVAAVAGALDPATGEPRPDRLPIPGVREEWYRYILMGFNTIDDACMTYIDDLWILERRKTRNSTIIHAAGAATAAILSAQVTPQTAAALLILSQAFGLAGVLNNAVADSYLYTQPASTIKRIVQKTTLEYRTDLAAKVASTSETEITYPVASVGAAYHHMREYLALCLPPTIQAQIDERLNGAKAIPDIPGTVRPAPQAKMTMSRTIGAPRGAIRPSTAITLQ